MRRIAVLVAIGASVVAWVMVAQQTQAPAEKGKKLYNTVKEKLAAGKQVVGITITSPDPNVYCAAANAGYDYTWIEMQHSPLTFGDVSKMIYACRGASAMPFIRVPDATESDIQKATDIGAIGIIVPTVDTVEKAQAAVRWAKYPPVGRRSQGLGQYGTLWGKDYRQTANDNMFVMVMIETPIGVENAEKIASVPGLDAIFAASTDLGNFSGTRQGQPEYEAMVKRIHDMTLAHHLALGGPQAWKDRPERPGFTFFQAGTEISLIPQGARVNLGIAPPQERGAQPARGGVAPVEGQER